MKTITALIASILFGCITDPQYASPAPMAKSAFLRVSCPVDTSYFYIVDSTYAENQYPGCPIDTAYMVPPSNQPGMVVK